MIRRIQYMLDGRLYEWAFSLGTLWLAVVILFWPTSITSGAFRRLTEVMEPETVAAYALAVSLAGMAALLTNGRSFLVGPTVRSICATMRAYLWGQFAYALFLLGANQDSPSIGFGFWVIFSFSELYVAYRAMVDVRRVF